MRTTLALLHLRGGFLYEHRPDLFPEGYLTTDETALWCRFYDERNKHG